MSLARQSHSKNGAPWQHLNYHPHLHQSSKEIKIVRLNRVGQQTNQKKKKKITWELALLAHKAVFLVGDKHSKYHLELALLAHKAECDCCHFVCVIA
jgi:hypothetical protein